MQLEHENSTKPTPEMVNRHASPDASDALRILVVDDGKDDADSLAMLLRYYDYCVEVCCDSREALAIAHEFHPAVVLLDLAMPNINGYQLARAMRQMDELHDIKLIAVTGFGLPEFEPLSLEAGFNHHMVKPVDINKIRTLIDARN